MFIFQDAPGLTTNNENLTLQMEANHPGILAALNQYIIQNQVKLIPIDYREGPIKVENFEFDGEKYTFTACRYDTYLEGRHLWNYYEDDDRIWYVYDPEGMLRGSIMANVPMQVEAESMGGVYGYRAVWTGKSWVFDDFDPADLPKVVRFRMW